MSFFKLKPYRDKAYLKWVADGVCSDCGIYDDTIVAHHLIGIGDGKMGGKACDLDVMGLCGSCHANIHLKTGNKQEQYKWIAKTLKSAIKAGYKFKID